MNKQNNTSSKNSKGDPSDLEAMMTIRDHAMAERMDENNTTLIKQWDTAVTTLNLVIRLVDTTRGDETLTCVENYADQAAKAYIGYAGKKDDKEHQRLYTEAFTFHQAVNLLKDLRTMRMIKEILEKLE